MFVKENTFGRRLYSLGKAYRNLYYGIRAMPKLKKFISSGLLTEKFKERIMLAVTEVNGCFMCSYAHTEMALESGLSKGEIDNILNSVLGDVPKDEQEGILFSQYYANNRGAVSLTAWEKIINDYGKDKALGILSAIQVIMMGNTFGIPLGSLIARFKKGDKYVIDERSSLPYEISMVVLFILSLPIALIHAIVGNLFNFSPLEFKD
ncbi:carboxymuconolactone decarboxylase family protein [Anaerosphaera multitolerans]|uniref:Carboxymuconolactone decarboxylase family protein n=1 Tax=Anaerosphaera multitolerans TaxID=2487351 RepID=A0A437S7U4_9FIRM|nr:carboxymuconolactone decarboxylase family protein [Anaerosphaera multitolerans]RVU54988.1 carboxymuconolactone decarboxylase family protein [Anaerosphaera multitolerans]